MPANCAAINIHSICTKCDFGFRLVAGICQGCPGPKSLNPCDTCPHNHYKNERGNCVVKDKHCLDVLPNGFCSSCKTGIGPFAGVCCPAGESFQWGSCLPIELFGGNDTGSGGQLTLDVAKTNDAWKNNCELIDVPAQKCIRCRKGFDFSAERLCVRKR